MSWNVQLQKICKKTITQTASPPSSWRFALRHWFRESDWLPILEVTLALDEESTGRVGDDTVGGPSVSRHGLGHAELGLESVNPSQVDTCAGRRGLPNLQYCLECSASGWCHLQYSKIPFENFFPVKTSCGKMMVQLVWKDARDIIG
ncbi:hypothetical protein Peur_071837 [Populus x canadensis]